MTMNATVIRSRLNPEGRPHRFQRLRAVVRWLQIFWKAECTRAERRNRVVPRY